MILLPEHQWWKKVPHYSLDFEVKFQGELPVLTLTNNGIFILLIINS